MLFKTGDFNTIPVIIVIQTIGVDMNLLELIGIIFIIALIFNIFIAIFALKGAERVKNIDLFEKEP